MGIRHDPKRVILGSLAALAAGGLITSVMISSVMAQLSPKPRLVTSKHGVRAYSVQQPCTAGIVNIDLVADEKGIYKPDRRDSLLEIIGGVATIIEINCSIKQVNIRKITYAGYAGGVVYYAAAVTPRGDWSDIRVVDIDAASVTP